MAEKKEPRTRALARARSIPTEVSRPEGRRAPDPNAFVENPPKQLGSPTAVHIQVPWNTAGMLEAAAVYGVMQAPLAEIVFLLRLKATPGCTSKLNHVSDVMHLYIEPGSEAARLFVSRMLRRLPPRADEEVPEVRARVAELLPERVAIPIGDSHLGCPICKSLMEWQEQEQRRVCQTCHHIVEVTIP